MRTVDEIWTELLDVFKRIDRFEELYADLPRQAEEIHLDFSWKGNMSRANSVDEIKRFRNKAGDLLVNMIELRAYSRALFRELTSHPGYRPQAAFFCKGEEISAPEAERLIDDDDIDDFPLLREFEGMTIAEALEAINERTH